MIACISIPYFAAAVERRIDATLGRKPLAIGGKPWEAKPIYAFSQEVARMGVKSGMSLRLVQVLSPRSHFIPAAETKYTQVSAEIFDVLTLFSYLIEPHEIWHTSADTEQGHTRDGRTLPARYYLDLETLPIQESIAFVKEIGKTLRGETSLAPAIGLASTKFTAQVAATVCRCNHALPVAPGHDARFLASQTIDFLPLDKETSRRFRLLGIRTLGQLANLPPSAVRTQFGPEIGQFYRLVRGEPMELFQARPLERREETGHHFEDPVTDAQVITAVFRRSAFELARRLQAAGLEGLELQLRLEMDDGSNQLFKLPFRHPTANADYFFTVLNELFSQASFACGITGASVVITRLQPVVEQQLTLFSEAAASHHAQHIIQNLAIKHRTSHFYRAVLAERDHPLPERRFQLQGMAGGSGALKGAVQAYDAALA